ncbi:PadR family transcriptional regulator [Pseudolysinimonas sp.]
MSSIRLYLLATLAEHGEMHGHQLRQIAERDHVHTWTDISVGALYGALKRMAGDGLIAEVRVEQVGGYPARSIWDVTDDGREALRTLRREALREIVTRPDPVDLALACLDPDHLDEVPGLVAERTEALRELLRDTEEKNLRIDRYLSPMERLVVTHRVARLRADLDWHVDLLAQLPELLADPASVKDPNA